MRLLSYLTPGFPPSLFRAFGRAIGADVDFDQRRSGPTAGVDPFGPGRYDLAWMCSTAYADLMARSPRPGSRQAAARVVGVGWVPDDPGAGGEPVYFSDLVVTPGSDIECFDDLAGRRIACNDRASLSGFHAFRFACRDRGVDPETFAELVFTGNHRRSLDAVAHGEIDVAAVDSIVRTGAGALNSRLGSLRVIERLGPWPVQPLVAGPSLSDADVVEVRSRLLDASTNPELQQELRAASLLSLVEVGPDHYERVSRELGQGR